MMRYVQAQNNTFIKHIHSDVTPIYLDARHNCPVRLLSAQDRLDLGVYPLKLVTPPAVNPLTQTRTEGDALLIDGAWVQQWVVTDLPSEQVAVNQTRAVQELQDNIVTATQKRLDDFGLTRGYSSTDSLAKYQNISDAEIAALPVADQATVTKFRTECRYLAVKIAQTWSVLYAGLAEVQAGTRPMPTGYADIEPLLPPLNWGSI